MAKKKQSINIFEAHVEKLVILLAVALLGWVVYSQFISPLGVEKSGRRLKPSAALEDAAKEADEIANTTKRPGDPLPGVEFSTHADEFGARDQIAITAVDKYPLYPIYLENPRALDRAPLQIPELPALSKPLIALTHATAVFPAEEKESDRNAIEEVQEEIVRDVVFVTVEAQVDMEKFRDAFAEAMAGPDVEDPLEQADPVIAAIDLQRAQLMPDGTWSEYESVRPVGFEDANFKFMGEQEVQTLSQAAYEVLLQDRARKADVQLNLLQPIPFVFEQEDWLSPGEKLALEEQERLERRGGGGRTGREREDRTTSRSRSSRQRQRQTPDAPGMAEMGMPGMPGMPGMEMGMPGMPGMPGDVGSRSRDRTVTGDFDDIWMDELAIWAHDADVRPGKVYRYRVRLGFFNPIAGLNRFVPEQQNLKNERILWSEPLEAGKLVHVPELLAFFPKAVKVEDQSATFEIFRWASGRWHRRLFTAGLGQSIGEVARVRRSSSETGRRGRNDQDQEDDRDQQDQYIEVDFQTGCRLVDIIDDSKHWYLAGNSMRDKVTTEVIYRDLEGLIRRVPVDKACWPAELDEQLSQINRAYRKQD